MRKIWIVGLICLLGALTVGGIIFIFQEREVFEKPLIEEPEQFIEEPERLVKEPERFVVNGEVLTGEVVLPPEAKGRIELTHRVIRGYGEADDPALLAPEIEIRIKNIGEEPLNFRAPAAYSQFALGVISKNKMGNTLGQPEYPSAFWLQPKEVKILRLELFNSDETKGYEIRIHYRKPPEVTGTYIESPEAAGKIELTHYVTIRDGSFKILYVEVKNISNETLGRTSRWGREVSVWYTEVIFRNAQGKVMRTTKEYFATPGDRFSPGERIKMDFVVPTFFGPHLGVFEPEEPKIYYELRVAERIISP